MRYHPVFEFLPVEHLIREHQQECYHALATGDDTGGCTGFVAFILAQIEKSLKQLIEESRGVTLTAENRIGIVPRLPLVTKPFHARIIKTCSRQFQRPRPAVTCIGASRSGS
jgi:hypothetical protein